MLNLHQILNRPWAVTPEIAGHVQRVYEVDGFAGLRALAALRDLRGYQDDRPEAAAKTTARRGGNVAVLPIYGMMTHRGGMVNCADTASTMKLAEEIGALASDASVAAIVLEIDSGGGEVDGTPELAAKIREARMAKPVVAHANTIAGSAAYWAFSQADEGIITPSGAVGSVGVYWLHEDQSKALEGQGRKVELVSAGKYKTEASPFSPLSDEARAAMQVEVDRLYGMFTSDVAKGRRVSVEAVRGGFGEGRMVGAKAAVAQGMADAVGTLDEAVARAARLAVERRGAGPSAMAEGDAIRLRRARG
jgi:signal peptide peptidase SppA